MPYLSVAEYVVRYGARETGLLSNVDTVPNGAGPGYDNTRVETAIQDAGDEVEAYVGKRYTVPVESPPSLLLGWVAAIARLKLAEGTGRVNDAIKEAADRVTRQLEQLVSKKLDLPIPEGGTAPVENGTGDIVTSNDRDCPSFTSRTLAGYSDVFTGGHCLPAWRRGG